MPGGLRIVAGQLVDGVIEHVADGNSQKLPGDLAAARVRQGLAQFRYQFAGLVDLRGAERFSRSAWTCDIDGTLAKLERIEPKLAAVLRNMFAARREGEADRLLQDIPSVLGHKRLVLLLRLARKLAARLWAMAVTGPG